MLAEALANKRGPMIYELRFLRRWGGLLAGYDVFRRFSQGLEVADLARLMELGLLDADGSRAGAAQRWPALDMPLVHFSVYWWRTLHQPPSLTAGGGPLQHRGVVGTHAGEQRHVVGALQHVDGVHLQDACARERPVERPQRRHGVPRVAEALRHQGDPPRLDHRERLQRQGMSRSFSRTAYMTASIREWSWSFSRMLRTWFFTVFSEM